MLQAEIASPWMFGMFYKATVQAVLLYGSETWSLFPSSLKRLEGFHIRATWQMLGKRPERNEDGSSLGGGAEGSWFENNRPLSGRALPDHHELNC